MDKHISSEEKLLRVIRKKDSDAAGAGAKNINPKRISPKSLGNLFSLILINRLLVGIVLLGLILSGIKYFSGAGQSGPDNLLKEKVSKDNISAANNLWADTKPYEFYVSEIAKKNLFQLPWEENVDNMNVASSSGANILQTFHLTGIVLDKDPKAVIENTSDQQTYFLSVGEAVSGAKVKEILADRVLLEYEGQILELKP